MRSVVFLCTANACRSQMAEGIARHLAGDRLRVQSAGTHPRGVDPRAVQVLGEIGIDIQQQTSKGLDALDLGGALTAITLCGDAATSCPTLPTGAQYLHWPLSDPAESTGSEAEVMQTFRRVRDEIMAYVSGWLAGEGLL
jgi:arsenate reductase